MELMKKGWASEFLLGDVELSKDMWGKRLYVMVMEVDEGELKVKLKEEEEMDEGELRKEVEWMNEWVRVFEGGMNEWE